MAIRELPKKAIDGFRTAPVGILETAISLGVEGLLLSDAPESFHSSETPGMAFMLLVLLNGANKIKRQFKTYRIIKKSLERDGFRESVMSKVVGSYCNRQSAIVACEQTGHLEEFEELCKSGKYLMLLTDCRHI